ncbi:AAEL006208-PA, partial [Aedes aegypti]
RCENILLKVLNREHSGYFSTGLNKRSHREAFREVPSHLSFCLKEIVPYCYLQGHVFMGLSACGQFLLSYKASCDYDEVITNEYNFSSNYKYELYFWIYRPHFLLSKYFHVCLFDDHGVDDIKTVSITQWKTDQRLLIVHGASEKEDQDSYVTVVRVPKLGCMDCKQMRDADEEDASQGSLCISCNMTIHTKYRNSDSGPKFNPRYNLNCPGYIIMSENSFIHTICIQLDLMEIKLENLVDSKPLAPKPDPPKPSMCETFPVPILPAPSQSLSIADQIIADFAEYETETFESKCSQTMHLRTTSRLSSSSSSSSRSHSTAVAQCPENFDELVITCDHRGQSVAIAPPRSSVLTRGAAARLSEALSPSSNIRLMNHRNNTNIELRLTAAHRTSPPDAHKSYVTRAYEFSEDNERCEKISIFRKRRLADKKYEFSEDSSHGDNVIVPFNRLRNQIRTRSASQALICSPSHSGYEMTTHLHRASPNHGFRSPCGSPVGNRYLRSPPGIRSPNYYRHHSPVGTPRPQQTPQQWPTLTRRITSTLAVVPPVQLRTSPSSSLMPSRTDEGNNENFNTDNLLPLKADLTGFGCNGTTVQETKPGKKPTCTKKIVKIFVEEDDANSVLTTEEDDCISPGYHASLPMEVHGSCYANMQIVSPASYQKLNCPAVVVTQNSFDMEAFSFHVANYICAKHDKKYGILFDSAYELTHVCPLTETITCTMVLQFTASDASKVKQCHNCSTTIDCRTHRKIYQCRSLFTWNIASGEWTVLDYGSLGSGPYLEVKKLASNYNRLLGKLRKFTRKLFDSSASATDELDSNRTYEYLNHLRVLDSNNEKTKQRLVDPMHMIEFFRRQPHDTG